MHQEPESNKQSSSNLSWDGRERRKRQRRSSLRRTLRMESLERRQLLAADMSLGTPPEAHVMISQYDYNGILMSNWRDLQALHDHSHGHDHNHDHGHHHDHDHDHSHDSACGCEACQGTLVSQGQDNDFSHSHDSGCTCEACLGTMDTQGQCNDLPGNHDPGCTCEACLGGPSVDAQQELSGISPSEFNAAYSWPQSGGLGSDVTLTYSYSNLLDGGLGGSLTNDQLRAATEEALGIWTDYAPLNFIEVIDSGPAVSDDTSYLAAGHPDIRIGHHSFDGPSGTLAHAYYPSTTYWGIAGDVHMDSGETWRLGAGSGIDFVEVMVHEIGHALGLGHEDTNSAIMNPYYGGRYSGLGTSYLLADDISGIRAIYGTGTGSVVPITSNNAPTIVPTDDVTMSVTTDSIDVTINASDADGDTLTYTADLHSSSEATADDVVLSVTNNVVTVDPTNFTGEIVIEVSVSDGEATSVDLFTVDVVNNAPVITPISDLTIPASTDSVDVAVTASDPDGQSLSYSASLHSSSQATADDVTISVTNNVVTVDPSAFIGAVVVEVEVSDGDLVATELFTVNVANNAPVITSIDDQSVSVTDTLDVVIAANDADGDALTYAAALHSSSTATASDVTVTVAGQTVTVDSNDFVGTAVVEVSVSDGFVSATELFTVEVTNDAPSIEPISDVVFPVSQSSTTVSVVAADSDGHEVTLNADAVIENTVEAEAYALDQQYNFFPAASEGYNYRGLGEKYFYGNGSQWFYILADGEVYQWGGSVAASNQVGQLDSSYFDDLSLIFNANPASSISVDVTLAWLGNDLTITPNDGSLTAFTVVVSASDPFVSTTSSFEVSMVNQTPTITDIADQSIAHTQDAIVIDVVASDADGQSLTLNAEAMIRDAAGQQAYDLQQQYSFRPARSESYNARGQGEKYFHGAGNQWFYMVNDGCIYRWGGSIAASTHVGSVDPSYHANLNLLYNAQQPVELPADVDLTWSGNQLTIDPADGFLGTFDVTVFVSDSISEESTSFQVSVTNTAPVLGTLADQVVSYSADTTTISIPVTDADGDTLQLDAETVAFDPVEQAAYDLNSQYRFRAAGTGSYNYRGAGEKYFYGDGSRFFFMLPGGEVYRWGGSINGSTQIAQLSSAYHTNLNLLFYATEPTAQEVDVDFSWSGTDLIVDPADGYAGSFQVVVTASDGVETATTMFGVTVENSAPVLTAIPDLSISPTVDSTTITVDAVDADGDVLVYSAAAAQADASQQAAYDLRTQYNFRSSGNSSYNYRGQGEKYFYGQGNAWFFILHDGSVHRWAGSIAGSPEVGQVDASYHQNLNTLFTVQEPTNVVVDVAFSFAGDQLTIDPGDGFAGDFQVTVSVTDGADTVTTDFTVSVVNHAPEIAAIADLTISPDTPTALNVAATDVDGETVALSATAVQVDPIAQTAYDLNINYGLRPASRESFNARGLGEKYLLGTGSWFYILGDGELYRWGGSVAASTLVGQVDATYHADLTRLYHATQPQNIAAPVTLSWNADELTITPDSGFEGSFDVIVSASDASETTQEEFSVTVVDQAPTIDPIADQTLDGSLTVTINTVDPEGQAVTLAVEAFHLDEVGHRAYELNTQYRFRPAANESFNYRGHGEKYFHGNGSEWFYILGEGEIYRWGGSIGASTLVGQLDSSFHSNLSTLFNASQPQVTTAPVTVQLSGNELTITNDNGFAGSFTVRVTATAGGKSTETEFAVDTSAPLQSVDSFFADGEDVLDEIHLMIDELANAINRQPQITASSFR